MSIFSERLKALRAESGLSLNDVAEECGISKSSVHLYELGTRNPKREALEELSCLFNVDIDYLLGITNVKNSAANQLGYSSLEEAYLAGVDINKKLPEQQMLSEGEELWLSLFRQIPDESRSEAVNYVRSALKIAGLIQ